MSKTKGLVVEVAIHHRRRRRSTTCPCERASCGRGTTATATVASTLEVTDTRSLKAPLLAELAIPALLLAAVLGAVAAVEMIPAASQAGVMPDPAILSWTSRSYALASGNARRADTSTCPRPRPRPRP
jgi:hypothetical protein